jgi:hypothetical protein
MRDWAPWWSRHGDIEDALSCVTDARLAGRFTRKGSLRLLFLNWAPWQASTRRATVATGRSETGGGPDPAVATEL